MGFVLTLWACQWVTGKAAQVARLNEFNERSLAALRRRNELTEESVDALRDISTSIDRYIPVEGETKLAGKDE